MRNPALALLLLTTASCAPTGLRPPPGPVIPIPADALAGSNIVVYPLNTMRADTVLGWDRELGDPALALKRVDSIVIAMLNRRLPQVKWAPNADLYKAAAQAPGLLTPPNEMATIQLMTHATDRLKEPLAAQLRQLTGATTGGRYALVPANLWFERKDATRGNAKLVVALVDVRRGAVSWSATMTGVGTSAWEAITSAVIILTSQEAAP